MTRAHHVARALQQSLLPPDLPEIAGFELADRYRPMSEANEIGGDFYDAFETVDGSWAIMVGDVEGKGPEAAAAVGLARYTLRAVAVRERSPARVLRMLNDALLRSRETSRYCTVALAKLIPMPKGATIVSATGGHPLPLVLRADGRVESVGSPGTLLGLLPDPSVADHGTELEPGDALVLYTDGVTEARRDREVFGDANLTQVLGSLAGRPADGIAAGIEQAVVDWQPEHRSDDLAVLVVRARPET